MPIETETYVSRSHEGARRQAKQHFVTSLLLATVAAKCMSGVVLIVLVTSSVVITLVFICLSGVVTLAASSEANRLMFGDSRKET